MIQYIRKLLRSKHVKNNPILIKILFKIVKQYTKT